MLRKKTDTVKNAVILCIDIDIEYHYEEKRKTVNLVVQNDDRKECELKKIGKI